jgi:Uma2 family endonuclease
MATLSKESVSAEKYDRMPEEICRRIEVVDGRVIMSPAASPRHNRIARMLANAIEEAAPAPWQVATGVDLRISDRPLHNRRPDVLVFDGDPDALPVRPEQVLLVVEITSDGGIDADCPGEFTDYAIAGIPWCWHVGRDRGSMIDIHRLDATNREYSLIGSHFGALKAETPFPVSVNLDALG